MTKQTDDLIDRIQGAATALKGIRAKLSPVPPPVPADVQPKPDISQEDWDFAKKVVADLKGSVEALEAEVSRESKVPGEHPDNKSKASESSSLPKAKV